MDANPKDTGDLRDDTTPPVVVASSSSSEARDARRVQQLLGCGGPLEGE